MFEQIGFVVSYLIGSMPIILLVISGILFLRHKQSAHSVFFFVGAVWFGVVIIALPSIWLMEPYSMVSAKRSVALVGLPIPPTAPMPSINEQEVRYVYQVDGSGVMVSNPIEPSYYMRRYAVVELSREFLLEGTPEKLYFTEIVATFKPFSEQLLEGNSPNNFVLEEHQRDSFQWLPWERLQDEQQWLAKERRNTAVILAQEELFCQQAIKAFQDYLATTTQPTIAAAQEAVVTSLERDWYMSDFTMIAKSNNW